MSACCRLRPIVARVLAPGFLARHASTSAGTSDNFTPIYMLPGIQGCSVVNKFKKLSLLATGTSVPISFVANAAGFVPADLPVFFASFGLFTTVTAFCVGEATHRLVGYIYLSEDSKKVKISYLDFWGRREDAVHDIDNIRRITPAPPPLDRFLKRIEVTTAKPYLISFKHGEVLKYQIFQDIFKYEFSEEESL